MLTKKMKIQNYFLDHVCTSITFSVPVFLARIDVTDFSCCSMCVQPIDNISSTVNLLTHIILHALHECIAVYFCLNSQNDSQYRELGPGPVNQFKNRRLQLVW